MIEIKVKGPDIQPGDIFRFRMSKHDPVRWLRVLSVVVGKPRGKKLIGTASITLEHGCSTFVEPAQWAFIRRDAANRG